MRTQKLQLPMSSVFGILRVLSILYHPAIFCSYICLTKTLKDLVFLHQNFITGSVDKALKHHSCWKIKRYSFCNSIVLFCVSWKELFWKFISTEKFLLLNLHKTIWEQPTVWQLTKKKIKILENFLLGGDFDYTQFRQRMITLWFSDLSLTFHLVPPSGQNFSLSNSLFFGQIPAKL